MSSNGKEKQVDFWVHETFENQVGNQERSLELEATGGHPQWTQDRCSQFPEKSNEFNVEPRDRSQPTANLLVAAGYYMNGWFLLFSCWLLLIAHQLYQVTRSHRGAPEVPNHQQLPGHAAEPVLHIAILTRGGWHQNLTFAIPQIGVVTSLVPGHPGAHPGVTGVSLAGISHPGHP